MINKTIIFAINIKIALLIVGFTLYRRFIVARLPKSLYIYNEFINYYFFATIIISFFVCLYLLLINIKYFIYKDNKQSAFFMKLNEIIDNALFELYNFIANILTNIIPDMYTKVSLLAENFYALFHKRIEGTLLFILYIIRVLIVITFLVDTFIFFKLNYFYKMLYLLSISLLIKILIYILRDFSKNLEDAESFLIIEHKGIDAKTELPITEFSLKEEYKKLNLKYYIKQYILCSKLIGYFQRYDLYAKTFTPSVNIVIYSLYLIGWSYILIINVRSLF